MTERHHDWTEEAIKNNPDLPDVTRHDPMYPPVVSLYHDNAVVGAWFPDNAMNRMTAADDPQREYCNLILEMLGEIDGERASYDEYADELPEYYGTPAHVASEMIGLSNRIVKGALNELRGATWLAENGHDVLTTEKALELSDEYENETQMETDDVDLMTRDGKKWQIKSSKGEAGKVENDDVITLIVGEEITRA